jgi:polar amino acid transport system permease protein
MSIPSPDRGGVAADASAATLRPDSIKAIPVRHWGRWISAVVVVYLMAALVVSFIKNPNVQWDVVWQYLFSSITMHGLLLTLELTFIAMVIGAAGGVILAVMRLSDNPVLSWIAWIYIWFFRGTPVYVQILIWGYFGSLYYKLYAGLPFTGIVFGSAQSSKVIGTLIAAILALGLNEAAYAAELVRAGIISVESGQSEAALSLGMSPALTMRRVVLPQAMRVIIPTMGNETISMLKTTSLIAVIGGLEMLGRLQQVWSQTFQIMPLIVVACIWYLFITSILTLGQARLEAYFGKGFGEKEAEAAEQRAVKRAARSRHV